MRICYYGLMFLLIALPCDAAPGALSVETQTIPQGGDSVSAVAVDCAALLHKAGIKAPFTAESVRAWLVGDDRKTAVESRAEAAEGIWRILWRVPSAVGPPKEGSVARFVLEFGGDPAPSGTPRLPAGSIPNLVDNGGFERLSPDGVPDGIPAAVFRKDFRLVPDERGGRALALNADAEGHGPTYNSPWVDIEGGRPYVYSFRHRAEKAEAHSRYKLIAYGYANYRDAGGQSIPRAGLFSTQLGDTGGWETVSITLVAPPNARRTNLEFNNGSKVPYSVCLDSVRIAAVAQAELSIASTADGRRVSLRAEDKDIRRFDLGTRSSPVWDGFQALTPKDSYSPEMGFGFTGQEGIEAADRTKPDALGRDFISANRADLRVDLPDGRYSVWLLTGDPQGGSSVFWVYFDQRLSINGQEVWARNPKPVEFFRTTYLAGYRNFWVPGMDFYNTIIRARYEPMTFQATVTGGKLMVSWSHLPVAALVIYPRRADVEAKAELARLAVQRRRSTPIEEVLNPKERTLSPAASEIKRGYVLFRRPANEAVFPTSRPKAGERVTSLSCFVTPGEYEPVHFSLLPLRNLGKVRVTSTDLVSGSRRIPASAVDVRVARYVFKQEGSTDGSYSYRVAPYFLDHRENVPGKEGVCWSWWAIVRVPDVTPPGVYKGALEIAAGTGKRHRLPWSVQVLPFRLAALPITQGFYYFPEEPWYAAFWGANVRGLSFRNDPEVRKLIERNEHQTLKFMISIGLNSAALTDDMRGDLELVDGKVRLKPDNRLALWMDVYRDEGMGPMPFYGFTPIGAANSLAWLDRDSMREQFSPAWTAAYRSLLEEGQHIGKERRWPEIIWYVADELSNLGEAGGKLGVELGKSLAGIGGVRTIASMNGRWEHAMVPHVTICMPNFAFPITEATVKMVRDAGSELWLYNCGDERLTLGLYPWRLSAGGRFQWHFHAMSGAPWDDFDGAGPDTGYCLALPSPDGIVPAIKSQITREAIDDHRYMATLEQALAAARNNSTKTDVVAKAERFLEALRSRIPVDIRTLVGYQIDPRAAKAAPGGEFRNADNLDRVRWTAAQLITELMAR